MNEVVEYQQKDLSDRKYQQNGASNNFDFNPPQPTLKMSGNGPGKSAVPASTPMNMESTTNSRQPQKHNQQPPQTTVKLKRTAESELTSKEEKLQKTSQDSGTAPIVKVDIENLKYISYKNQLHSLQHSIFQDENNITHESGDFDDSHIDNTNDSYTEEEIEKNTKYLKCRPGSVRQGRQRSNKSKDYTDDGASEPEGENGRQCPNKVEDHTDDQEPEPEDDNASVPLVAATTPIEAVINFFQQQKLLSSEMMCDRCNKYMDWKEGNWAVVGFFWECKNKNCPTYSGGTGHRNKKIITTGTFFHKSKISLPKWFDIMYLWCKRVGRQEMCNQLNLHKKTIIGIYRFFREVCEAYFKANPIKLGGPGIDIEIDICTINISSKLPKPPLLVLCIVGTFSIPSIGYMEIVETRDVGTLFPTILKVVEPGSIIHSKEWRAYRKIQDLFNMDRTVNHPLNFVDVNMNIHEQTIGSYWIRNKGYLTAMKAGYRNSFLQEIMWHERFSDNALENLCQQIAAQYDDASYIDKTDDPCLGDETQKQEHDLEMKLVENSIGLTQESVVHDTSYGENTDGSCSREEIEKDMGYLEVQLEENKNYVEETPNKFRSGVQEGRQCPKEVKDYIDDGESEPEGDNGSQNHYKVEDDNDYHDHESEPEGDSEFVPQYAANIPMMNVIKFFQQHKVLKSEMNCEHCDTSMTWKEGSWTAAGFYWECRNKKCPTYSGGTHHRNKVNVTTGTFFHKSKLSLLKWYDIMHLWSKRVGVKATSEQVNASRKTITACYSFLREVCQVYFESNPVKLGGPGITIEIEISCLSNEPLRIKYGPWVICIIESYNYITGYMEMVDTRDVAALLPIIIKVVQPGSIVHTKEWRAYRNIQALSYMDAIVSFVDVDTSVHKETIESYLSKHKSMYIAMKGGKKSNMNSYLQEFMWHERFSDNALESLCQQIADAYTDL